MRKAVGDSGDEQRLIRTVARKGFRFVGEVKEEQGHAFEDAGAPVAEPNTVLALAIRKRRDE